MSTQQSSEPPEQPPVGDDVLVYRLVPIWWCDVIDGEWEFQSGAFDNATPEREDERPDDMSVILGDTLAGLGRIPEELPRETPWAGNEWGVAVLEARYLRQDEGQELRRTPDEEPAHGDVRGKKNQKRRRRLKANAAWVSRPAVPPV